MDVASADGTDARLDAREIDVASLDPREPPVSFAASQGNYHVFLSASTWKAMQQHAHSVTDKEVGGVMLGKVFRDGSGKAWLCVDGVVPALAAESRSANVTFTADAWTRIHDTIDRDHPGAAIVGWYHTHPSFGIFLSDMDVFIQRHFFNLPHQIAVVIDPVARTHGCFVWRDGVPTNEPYWIEGEPAPKLSPTQPQPSPARQDLPSAGALPRAKPIAQPAMDSEPALSGKQANHRFKPPKRSRSHLRDFLGRLDAGQWAALITLVLVTVMLLAALVVVFLNPET